MNEQNNCIAQLSDLLENGKLVYDSNIEGHFRHAITSMFLESPYKLGSSSNGNIFQAFMRPTPMSTDGSLIGGVTAVFQHMKNFTRSINTNKRNPVSGLTQFLILFRMMMVRTMRAKIPLIIQLLHHASVGLFFGKF